MVTVTTELGCSVNIPKVYTGMQQASLIFPYTTELAFGALDQQIPLENVFAYRNIKHPDLKELLTDSIHYWKAQGRLPLQSIQQAAAMVMHHDYFPSLSLHFRKRTAYDGGANGFTFATSINENQTFTSLPAPADLSPAERQRWLELSPHQVDFFVGPTGQWGGIRLTGNNRWLSQYSAQELRNARHRILTIIGQGPQMRVPKNHQIRPDDNKSTKHL